MLYEPALGNVQVAVRRIFDHKSRILGVYHPTQPITAPGKLFDEILARNRTMHGVLRDGAEFSQHTLGIGNKESQEVGAPVFVERHDVAVREAFETEAPGGRDGPCPVAAVFLEPTLFHQEVDDF